MRKYTKSNRLTAESFAGKLLKLLLGNMAGNLRRINKIHLTIIALYAYTLACFNSKSNQKEHTGNIFLESIYLKQG